MKEVEGGDVRQDPRGDGVDGGVGGGGGGAGGEGGGGERD